MSHQNRVNPFGKLIATPERGMLYGNRGSLHNDRQQIRRQFQGIRWIVCVLEFKGRKHQIMRPGHYTELFFLDEATAFAAGHRPCAECQRERFNLFRQYWAAANPEDAGSDRPLAPVMDAVLHKERLGQYLLCGSVNELPDGTFISSNAVTAYLVFKKRLLLWTPGGYVSEKPPKVDFPANVLTPASLVRTLAAGYIR